MSLLEPEDTDVVTHLLLTTYLVAAGSIAVTKANNIPALMGLNPSRDRQILSKLNK